MVGPASGTGNVRNDVPTATERAVTNVTVEHINAPPVIPFNELVQLEHRSTAYSQDSIGERRRAAEEELPGGAPSKKPSKLTVITDNNQTVTIDSNKVTLPNGIVIDLAQNNLAQLAVLLNQPPPVQTTNQATSPLPNQGVGESTQTDTIQTVEQDAQTEVIIDMRPERRVSVDMNTVIGTSDLYGHKLNDRRLQQGEQDIEMAKRIGEASSVPLPNRVRNGDYMGVPLDIMPVIEDGKVRFQILEHNSSGWGGTSMLPANVLKTIQHTFRMVGRDLAETGGNDLVVLVASSGRQEIDEKTGKPKPNASILEKVIYADAMAEPMRVKLGNENVDVISFDPDKFHQQANPENSAWRTKPIPTIVVGYTPELTAAKGLEFLQGKAHFYGRPVKVMVNDRFIANLQEAHKTEGALDPERTLLMNRSVDIGVDKFLAYLAANDYNKAGGNEFASCAGETLCYHAESRDDVVRSVKAILEKGKPAIIKPHGSGWGYGIKSFQDLDASDSDIRRAIAESVEEVEEKINKPAKKTVAGYPYTIMQYFQAETFKAPENSPYAHADGWKYELRIGVYADHTGDEPTLKAVPVYIKLQAPDSEVANISTQIAATGLTASDFTMPICNQENLKLLGMTEADITEVCKWSTGYASHVLSNLDKYSRTTPPATPPQVSGGAAEASGSQA